MLTRCSHRPWRTVAAMATLALAIAAHARAADQPQWGQAWSRNMVSAETGLPARFAPPDIDKATGRAVPGTGTNVAWVVPLGTRTYGTPVVAGGSVLVGTNNGRPRDPRHADDRSILLCLDEATGALRWQFVSPKLDPKNPYLDWPKVGICSPATVEGDRAYLLTNRDEVVCLDMAGMANGNDGPFRDEAQHAVPRGQPPVPPGKTDADILWVFDMMNKEVGAKPHDQAHCAPMIHGRCLYVGTSNGIDRTHRGMITPDARSLVCLDKETGRLLAADAERIGPQIIHSQWSSPSLGRVGGRDLVFYGGGDCVCYAFEALREPLPAAPTSLKTVWRFHCDPAGRRDNPLRFQDNREECPSKITAIPVFVDGRIYVTAGGDYWHGRRECWIKCIDATGAGDVTKTHEVWSRPLNRHCMATPAVADGLVYISDCGKTVHCFDAATGDTVWTHTMRGEGGWSSPLVADGKVYVTTTARRVWVLAAGREKEVLGQTTLDTRLYGSPVAANGRLYITSEKYLYVFEKGATSK